jgi:hypothetical protein
MANTKISELAAAATLDGTEQVPVVQSGTTKRTTVALLNAQSGTSVRGCLPSGYAQVVANQGSITTETDLTGLTVTVTVNSGERIKITGHIAVASGTAQDLMELKIKESTTVLAIARCHQGTASGFQTLHAEVVLTPSAASHTYKLSLVRDTGSGTLTMSAGATFPAFILVEGIGT